MTHTKAADNPNLPRHVAIIMDGNGRWAKQRGLPRIAGHKAGVHSLREIVKSCTALGIRVLTVYAFSTENWKRPVAEVSRLMELFLASLRKEISELNKNNIRLRFIGDYKPFPEKLKESIEEAQQVTRNNSGLQFVVAVNYGGRWDIMYALFQVAEKIRGGELEIRDINEQLFASYLALADLPPPDLFIRTGGEKRISNFLLWQLAYTELYFTDCLWPDFGPDRFAEALHWFAGRERRFGLTSEQLQQVKRA
ncbi:MAG: isoprenyl transferase [Gammaproteobacteria bacterium]